MCPIHRLIDCGYDIACLHLGGTNKYRLDQKGNGIHICIPIKSQKQFFLGIMGHIKVRRDPSNVKSWHFFFANLLEEMKADCSKFIILIIIYLVIICFSRLFIHTCLFNGCVCVFPVLSSQLLRPGSQDPSNVIIVRITAIAIPVTIDSLYMLFSYYGKVHKVRQVSHNQLVVL